jgi:hypothetical protein
LLLLFATPAAASPIYDLPAAFTGTRTVTDPGLLATDPDWYGAMISWSINQNPDHSFTYTYTFTGFDRPTISHYTLDISDTALTDPQAIYNACLDGALIPASKIEKGNKDGITGAVKFDKGAFGSTSVLKFNSNRSPVWGDIYIKGGQTNLKNTGFGDRISSEPCDYIARPDGCAVLPEPAATAAAAVGLGMIFRRR